MGRIAGFDHLAITAADPEATMAFYRDVLGAEMLYVFQRPRRKSSGAIVD